MAAVAMTALALVVANQGEEPAGATAALQLAVTSSAFQWPGRGAALGHRAVLALVGWAAVWSGFGRVFRKNCRSPSDSAAAAPADLGTRRETNDQNDPKMRVATEPNGQIDRQDWLCEMEMEETKKVDDSRMYVT